MTSPAEELKTHLHERLEHVVFGMTHVVHGLCLTLVTGGHVLLEGVPGLGKTLLAKTLAAQLGGRFKRIQCTADLMPSDITGIHVYNAESHKFVLMAGPLFADVVLVDEINRTGPKTQSALLEAMEEGNVTIDRKTYDLPRDFLVIASQNPHELEGTYPLPESQLDRFLLRLDLTYPPPDMEQRVLETYDRPGGGHRAVESPATTIPPTLIEEAREQVRKVHVSDALYKYVVQIGKTSRAHDHVSLGLSTRGILALMRTARVEAALRGSEFVTPDDVKLVARPVIAHRLILTPDAALEGIGAVEVVKAVLNQVRVPRE